MVVEETILVTTKEVVWLLRRWWHHVQFGDNSGTGGENNDRGNGLDNTID